MASPRLTKLPNYVAPNSQKPIKSSRKKITFQAVLRTVTEPVWLSWTEPRMSQNTRSTDNDLEANSKSAVISTLNYHTWQCVVSTQPADTDPPRQRGQTQLPRHPKNCPPFLHALCHKHRPERYISCSRQHGEFRPIRELRWDPTWRYRPIGGQETCHVVTFNQRQSKTMDCNSFLILLRVTSLRRSLNGSRGGFSVIKGTITTLQGKVTKRRLDKLIKAHEVQ